MIFADATDCRLNKLPEYTYHVKNTTKNFKLKIIQPKVNQARDFILANTIIEFFQKIEPDFKFRSLFYDVNCERHTSPN
jgi:hypothetical protein